MHTQKHTYDTNFFLNLQAFHEYQSSCVNAPMTDSQINSLAFSFINEANCWQRLHLTRWNYNMKMQCKCVLDAQLDYLMYSELKQKPSLLLQHSILSSQNLT